MVFSELQMGSAKEQISLIDEKQQKVVFVKIYPIHSVPCNIQEVINFFKKS